MSTKVKLTITAILTYCVFAILAVTLGFLSPHKIGMTWSVFWYIAAACIVYYLWFKNLVFQRVLFYARQLKLTKQDLETMLPKLKKNQVVPDPNRRHLMAPIFNFPLQGLDILDRKLADVIKDKDIKKFR